LGRAYAAWIVVCIVWGTTYLGMRIAIETIPPLLMAAFRWIGAGTALLVLLASLGETLPPPRSWPSLAVLGVLLVGIGNGAVVWAERTVPSGLTAVLVATIPFWLVGIEAIRGDRSSLTVRRVAGLVIGFSGIVLLVWPDTAASGSRTFLEGVASTQLACFGWAIGSSYARRREPEENVLAVAAFEMLFGGIALLLAGTLHGEWPLLAFSTRTASALAYLSAIGSIGGFTAYAYALKHLPVATVSLYGYVNPVIAVVLGTIVLSEPFTARMAVAAAVVLAGIVMVREARA
jgi:drug/metabolite transporter (DMT)-like permease